MGGLDWLLALVAVYYGVVVALAIATNRLAAGVILPLLVH